MALSNQQEEIELFIEDYTKQIRMMSGLSDIQIKVVLKHLMEEDPEWFDILKGRFKRRQLKMTKELIKDVSNDISGSIKDLARKVA